MRPMKPQDIINLYGTQAEAGKALGISQSAISQWLRDGEVPYLRQHQIQVITAGRLVAKLNDRPDSVEVKAKSAA